MNKNWSHNFPSDEWGGHNPHAYYLLIKNPVYNTQDLIKNYTVAAQMVSECVVYQCEFIILGGGGLGLNNPCVIFICGAS